MYYHEKNTMQYPGLAVLFFVAFGTLCDDVL